MTCGHKPRESRRRRCRPEAFFLLLCIPFGGCVGERSERPQQPDPLIPLDTLFSGNSYDAPQISPDGEWIAWIGPLDGVANLFVAPADDPGAARPLTRNRVRGIQATDVSGNVMYRWSTDSTRLIFPQDADGDESWNLFVVDVASGEERNLTRLEGVKVELLALSANSPNEALVSIPLRDPMLGDLYRLDLDTGERTLVEHNPGFLGFVADHELRPRVALRLDGEGGIELLAADGGGGWKAMFTVGLDDLPALSATGYQKIARFDHDNRRLHLYDSRGRDTIALAAWDFAAERLEILAADERVDIGGVLYHPSEHRAQAYATNWLRMRWHPLDEAIAGDLAFLEAATEGEVTVLSRSTDDRRWIVRFMLAHEPISFQLYERRGQRLEELFVTTPELAGVRLSKMYPVVVESRDGLDLVSYLSYPPWMDPDDDGRPQQPVPLVLLVHGGPSDERATYAYGPVVHWLANRGYAVFFVNFRGSPGFGKAFVNAQRMEWGGKMHDDLVDQVEWAIAEGITTRDRVAIVGGSYGGYAALVGMTMTPDVFACGIDLVGPSNLEIFMPHWNVDMMSKVLGDPRTEEGRQLLRSRSPIHFAHQAKNPILIGQGANDSRVPQDQSDSMVEVFEENGVEVTYVLYPDEGHGLYRAENNFSFWSIGEVFLSQCLGGRAAPITDELEGSSAQVLVGAEHIPGLEAALQRRDAASEAGKDGEEG